MSPSRDDHRHNYSFVHRAEALINERLNWMGHKQMPLPTEVQFAIVTEWNHDTKHIDLRFVFWGETDQGQVSTNPIWPDARSFDRDAAHILVDQSMATMMAAREVLNNPAVPTTPTAPQPIAQGA